MNWDEISIVYTGPSKDAVSDVKIFWKSTNQKQEWPVASMFVNGSGRNEQTL
jgi:hypothetical protein